jgi:polyisoprenoid-binding protein YceI
MKSILSALIFLVATFSVSLSAQQIDLANSIVNFSIGNMKVNTVKGTFTGMKGEVHVQKDKLSSTSFNVCVDASTVNTGLEKRDHHLKTVDFFNVEKFPTICFVSTQVVKTDAGYMAKGDLTMHGVSRPVEIPFTLENNTLTGSISVSRYDYEVGKDTGTFMVSKDVDIEIICVLK